MVIQQGQTILNGKYRILRLIGQGGMACVWLAEELTLGDRLVAIKEPRSDLSPDDAQEVRKRYEREVWLCAALEKARIPNIVRVLTSEQYQGEVLLVLEYMPGGDLEAMLKRHPGGLSVEGAVAITLDLLQALEQVHAHQLEIVHRDIKPSNVLFDERGKAHLADFGLAQLAGISGRSKLGGPPHPGTPGYMAPEQHPDTRYLGPTADLYAVGCVLFEMLTGQRYQRHSPGTPACAIRSEVPAWLDDVLASALAEDPLKRWQNAREMATALRAGPKASLRRQVPKPRTQVPQSQPPPSRLSMAVRQLGAKDQATALLELVGEFGCLLVALISFLRPGLLWPSEMTDTLTAFVGVVTASIALFIPARRLYRAAAAPSMWRPPRVTMATQDLPAASHLFVLGMVVCSGIFATTIFFGFLAFLSESGPAETPMANVTFTPAAATWTHTASVSPSVQSPVPSTDIPLAATTQIPVTATSLWSETSSLENTSPPPSNTASVTSRAPTSTKAAATPVPTKKPPTATRKPPTATTAAARYVAPSLISPTDGEAFAGRTVQVVFRWTSVGELAADDYYVVVVPHSQDPDGHEEWTKATTWDQTGWLYDYVLPDRQFTWYVVVKRDTGGGDSSLGLEVGARSATRHFYWYAGEGGPATEGAATPAPEITQPPVVTPPGP